MNGDQWARALTLLSIDVACLRVCSVGRTEQRRPRPLVNRSFVNAGFIGDYCRHGTSVAASGWLSKRTRSIAGCEHQENRVYSFGDHKAAVDKN